MSNSTDPGGNTPMKYANVIRYVLETPWAIRPAVLAAIVDVLAYRAAGGQFTDEELADRIGGAQAARRAHRQHRSVAVIPLYGSIFPRANLITEMSGGTSLQKFQSVLTEAANDDVVASIVIDVASPGGMVDLVHETADLVRQIPKPVTAVANTEAASAAYWIAAQADELVVTPSGQAGSIGVFSAHEDWSRHDEQLGVDTTLVFAGKHKVDGSPFEPLSEEARAYMQKVVNSYYDKFVNAVAQGRGKSTTAVRNGFGQGRMVVAEDAVTEGMADRVAPFDQIISEHAQGSTPLSRSTFRSSDVDGFYTALLEHLPTASDGADSQPAPAAAGEFYESLLEKLSRGSEVA